MDEDGTRINKNQISEAASPGGIIGYPVAKSHIVNYLFLVSGLWVELGQALLRLSDSRQNHLIDATHHVLLK